MASAGEPKIFIVLCFVILVLVILYIAKFEKEQETKIAVAMSKKNYRHKKIQERKGGKGMATKKNNLF